MKKLAFLTCAVFLSSIILTSCKKDQNEPQKQNEVVKTEFSIELPNQVKAGPNRMPGTTVQKNGRSQFQGMTSIFLVPFVKQSDIVSGDSRLGNNIHLGDIADASALGTVSNAKVYTNVSIPLTTASFLFYAKSAAAGTKFEVGSLVAADTANNKQPADYHFDLEPIIANLATAEADAKAVALLAYVNSLANASDGTHAWKEYDVADPATYDPAMAAMFVEYKKLHTLSSNGVQRLMHDFYNSLVPLTTTLATALKTAIAAKATITGPDASGDYAVTLEDALVGYPTNLLLPEEAVHIKWDATAFRFCTEAEYTADNHALPHMFTYPSALWYYANSQIKTSNSSKKDMYNNTNAWGDILAAHTDSRAVNTNTRAVAIADTIQYAVARLDVQVKLAAGVLEDNTPVVAKNITNASYPITGIFVGSQKNVGFDFTPVGATNYTIYDNVMTPTAESTPLPMEATTSYSNMNSTLVLETAAGPATDKDVRICVEFTNTSGEDFIGVDGCLIPAGSKFYIVANLASADATQTGNKVFKQDYTTTVQLNLKSLKNAYNTIPDLRTPKLELGFSVNMSWLSGHTYTMDID
ncbi:MAG: hypothetical protein II825_08690 [Paludibacteraceae bacterium]|nr:hypothetical protein [Paludibacteraceae bacterium]